MKPEREKAEAESENKTNDAGGNLALIKSLVEEARFSGRIHKKDKG